MIVALKAQSVGLDWTSLFAYLVDILKVIDSRGRRLGAHKDLARSVAIRIYWT
jgi:hypothetical protein